MWVYSCYHCVVILNPQVIQNGPKLGRTPLRAKVILLHESGGKHTELPVVRDQMDQVSKLLP